MFRLGFAALAASALFLISGPALSAPPTVTTPPSAAAMQQLPRVAILATGGTIASRGSNALSLTDYGVGSGHKPVGIEVLVNAVPEIKQFAEISGEQVFNVGSSKLSIDNWLTLAAASIRSLQTSTRMASSSHMVPIRLRKQRTFLTSL